MVAPNINPSTWEEVEEEVEVGRSPVPGQPGYILRPLSDKQNTTIKTKALARLHRRLDAHSVCKWEEKAQLMLYRLLTSPRTSG